MKNNFSRRDFVKSSLLTGVAAPYLAFSPQAMGQSHSQAVSQPQSSHQPQGQTDRPNVLLITCDQLRACSLGCYGNDVIKTPNIDRLAARGVCFDRTFTAAPVCAPNRGAICTGRYPTVHGLTINGMQLPKQELTLMEVLRQAGYRTFGTGKMHFGPQWKFPPKGERNIDPPPDRTFSPQPEPSEMPWYGFEQVQLTEDHRVGPYTDYLAAHGYNTWDDPHSFTYPQSICTRSIFPEEHFQTTWIADRAIDFMRDRSANKPFFGWVSFVRPHHPFVAPAPYDTMYDPKDMPVPIRREGEEEDWPQKYQNKYHANFKVTGRGGHEGVGMDTFTDADFQKVRAYYYGMISLIDKQVGRMMDTLEQQGQLDNTVVVFTSDHGEMLGDHGLLFKGTAYDEVTRVPMIVSGPGIDVQGERRDAFCCSIDLMPTVLDLAGLQTPDTVQGQSMTTLVRDPAPEGWRDSVLVELRGSARVIRTRDWLMAWRGPGNRGELYDLQADPHCLYNLWDDPKASVNKVRLANELLQLVAANYDPQWKKLGAC